MRLPSTKKMDFGVAIIHLNLKSYNAFIMNSNQTNRLQDRRIEQEKQTLESDI